MNFFLFFSAFLLTGCFQSADLAVVQTLQSEKGTLTHLEKKLKQAEKVKHEAKLEVAAIKKEIDVAKIALIRKHIDEFKEGKVSSKGLFTEEREVLYNMIQEGSSSIAFEAQLELDRILRMITEQGNQEKKHVF